MALQTYIDGFSKRTGISVDLKLSSNFGRTSSDVELVFFRVIQEALTNIWRHSGSRTARIELLRQATGGSSQITLSIEDAGMGVPGNIRMSTLSPGGSRSQAPLGLGLLGMRERLHEIGAKLGIDSTAGKTVIRAIVTLYQHKEGSADTGSARGS